MLTKIASASSATLVFVAALSLALAFEDAASAKTKKRSRRVTAANCYLVPPPPPYTPSILPENHGGRGTITSANVQQSEEVKPENPYKKYIYTPNENDIPHSVQPNRYVSYWNRS